AAAPALALSGSEPAYRGGEGVRRWLDELRATSTTIRAYPDELVDADDRRVVVSGRIAVEDGDGRGYGSLAGWIYTIEGERIARIETFPHPPLALQAAARSRSRVARASHRAPIRRPDMRRDPSCPAALVAAAHLVLSPCAPRGL